MLNLLRDVWAHSTVVIHAHGMGETRVRFSVGPWACRSMVGQTVRVG